jgi:hypothetical protein
METWREGSSVVVKRTTRAGVQTLVGLIVVTALGCASETASGPSPGIELARPTFNTTYDTYSSIPCNSAAAPACGQTVARIAPNPPVVTPWVMIHYLDLGAYARTYTLNGQTMVISLSGQGDVKRGGGIFPKTESFTLNCDATGKECGDGWHAYNSCDYERNEVNASTRHFAQAGLTIWRATTTDRAICYGPSQHEEDGGVGEECEDDGEYVDDPSYDPYGDGGDDGWDGGADDDCNSGGSGGGEQEGSGIQYYPGDYTGGETVDWETGIGNGGSSVCGGAAMVDYACIDTWNGETGEWDEWGCGYVTRC